ncbi:MAG: two-component system response regulator [Zetaproteobacteria bacterium]|nr:two-component system response regulator [Pseudobdellovibrionaceae bacterium]
MRNILIVDDSEMTRSFLHSRLKVLYEVSVTEATNGKEGLTSLNKNPDIDLIICDIHMPEMNGAEFIKAVRSSSFNSIPIVVMTTTGMVDDIEEVIECGANGVIYKPFDPEKLQIVFDRFIE